MLVLRASGEIAVRADAPIEAAIGDGPFAPAPVSLQPPPESAWHGLPGAVEVRLRRGDAGQDTRVELTDGGTGVVVDWPREAASPGLAPGWVALGLASGGLVARRSPRLGQGSCSTPRSPPR